MHGDHFCGDVPELVRICWKCGTRDDDHRKQSARKQQRSVHIALAARPRHLIRVARKHQGFL